MRRFRRLLGGIKCYEGPWGSCLFNGDPRRSKKDHRAFSGVLEGAQEAWGVIFEVIGGYRGFCEVLGDLEDCWLVWVLFWDLGGSGAVKDWITGGFQGVLDPRKVFVRGISRSLSGQNRSGRFLGGFGGLS